jgi:hypothetical protein
MAASKSTSTWNRQNSALNSLNLCAKVLGLKICWPLTPNVLRQFVTWALKTKKLSVATIKMYISDLKNIHKLKDLDCNNFEDFFYKFHVEGCGKLGNV